MKLVRYVNFSTTGSFFAERFVLAALLALLTREEVPALTTPQISYEMRQRVGDD